MTYKEMSRQKHRKETMFKKAASVVCFIGGFAGYITGLLMVYSHPRISTALIILGIELALKVGSDNDWFVEDDEEECEVNDDSEVNLQ